MGEEENKSDTFEENRRADKQGGEVIPTQFSATTQTHLAWIRTRMSLENTLSSWVRTASSLIGFGFAIVQFFEQFSRAPAGSYMARYVGLLLMGVGTLTTGLAIWAYKRIVNYLNGDAFVEVARIPGLRRTFPDPALVVALIVCFIGLFAFFAILSGGGIPSPGRS